MKKKELEKLEKLNEQKKLTPEVRENIRKKVFSNCLIALDILLLFIVLMMAARNLDKNITIIIYKISSVIFFVLTFSLFEIAYNKDNDSICINGIEMLFVSIITLLTPYIFLQRTSVVTSIVGSYIAAYYILKNLIIYRKEKNKFLREQSDIPQIIKKESKDKKAQEEKQKQVVQKEDAPKRKRGRPKKTVVK